MSDIENWLNSFNDLNPKEESEETYGKEHKNDLFNSVLPALDRRDVRYYSKLTDEQKKDIGIWPLRRWMSSTPSSYEDRIFYSNQVSNVYSKVLSGRSFRKSEDRPDKHKELEWMLLAICGSGKREKHVWPGAPKGQKKNLLEEYLLKIYPLLKDDELEMLQLTNSREDFEEFLRECSLDDKSIREILESAFKK